jgi:hypothetical protein
MVGTQLLSLAQSTYISLHLNLLASVLHLDVKQIIHGLFLCSYKGMADALTGIAILM